MKKWFGLFMFEVLMQSRFIIFFFLQAFLLNAQETPGSAAHMVIGFYNVENLYDTIDDPLKDDDEFTPAGKLRWTSERYYHKLNRLSEVIAAIGSEVSANGPELLGLCEVENSAVLKDLFAAPALSKRQYRHILMEGPDARGVDVALAYDPAVFELKKAVSYHVKLATDSTHKTRDILVVSAMYHGDPVCVLVNHWPSRRGGEFASRANRIAAAIKARAIADSVLNSEPKTHLIIMGDLNDDPVNESVKKVLGTSADLQDLKNNQFFNPMEKLYKRGIGTLAWQDSWNLFDQVLLSANWFAQNQRWAFRSAGVYNKKFLASSQGKYRDYPFRTYSGGSYTGGYSDHFPAFIVLQVR
jgi:hypothetical protein